MKFAEEVMEILEAFDLTQSYRTAAQLADCSHNTVAHYVTAREAGGLSARQVRRTQLLDPYLEKIEEWVEGSHGKLRADVAHEKLTAMGYQGSERTARRGVAAAKSSWEAGYRRIYRPWVVEPGLWFLCGIPHKNHYAAAAIMRRHSWWGLPLRSGWTPRH
ncbi:MAG: hypothetical protein ACYCZN_15110 [Candidatus Dormibacteria bacterium]